MAAVSETEGDQRFDSLRYVINDFSGCISLNVMPSVVEEIAAIDHAAASMNRNIRIAIVATLPEVLAVANAYKSDPLHVYPTRIFGTMTEARTWLGLPLV
jgi:hypothetical protein